MIDPEQSPWCTRNEAASYLGFDDAESVDSRLTDSAEFQSGKIRYRMLKRKVRLWAADVLAMLPPFERAKQ